MSKKPKGLQLKSLFKDSSFWKSFDDLVRESPRDEKLIAAVYSETALIAKADDKQQKQEQRFSDSGKAARIKYTEEDKALWNEIAKEKSLKEKTASHKARVIAQRVGLPKAAEQSIRKEIGGK